MHRRLLSEMDGSLGQHMELSILLLRLLLLPYRAVSVCCLHMSTSTTSGLQNEFFGDYICTPSSNEWPFHCRGAGRMAVNDRPLTGHEGDA